MKEEPVISAGAIKAVLALLVIAGLGVGTWALLDGRLGDIELPELPDLETTDELTTLSDTSLEETTIGGGTAPQSVNPFTARGLRRAVSALRAEVGPGADLTRVAINPVQTIFHVRRGEGAVGYGFRADGSGLEELPVTVQGSGPLSAIDFPLAAVRPAVLTRLLGGTYLLLETPAVEFDVFDLSRSPIDNTLRWTLSVTSRGRSYTLRAGPRGGGLEDLSGGGVEVPPAVLDAREQSRCIAEAQDPEAIIDCLEN